MGIGRLGGVYQSYPIEPIKRVEPDTVRLQDELQKQQEVGASQVYAPDAQETPDNRSKTANLENISLNFNTGDTYDYIGKDSSLELLDMEQVISDMKKDSVLDQYRYFVGAEEAADGFSGGLSGDGIVVIK